MTARSNWLVATGFAALAGLTVGPAGACEWHTVSDASGARSPMVLAQATDQARPARGPQSEISLPNAAPPASPTDTTAASNQPLEIKKMNESEKAKVDQAGK